VCSFGWGRMLLTWVFWIVCVGVVTFIFWRLWKYAEKIERLEQEERQWIEYINSLQQIDPNAAAYWQQMFEQKFKMRWATFHYSTVYQMPCQYAKMLTRMAGPSSR
jgi:hypothetical protein